MAEQLRRERLRREMINEIIGAARMLLEKHGPGAISVRAIARQVGVTAPAIYRYYPSLDALTGALRESVVSELCAAVESARFQPGGPAGAFRGWALDHPASFRFALGLDGPAAAGASLMVRLSRLSVPPVPSAPSAPSARPVPSARPAPPALPAPLASVLGWAALCGLVLLELGCDQEDLPADISQLYAAAGLTGAAGPPGAANVVSAGSALPSASPCASTLVSRHSRTTP